MPKGRLRRELVPISRGERSIRSVIVVHVHPTSLALGDLLGE